MKPKRILPWTMMILCLALMQMAAGVVSAQPLEFKVIAGQWTRIDGNYTLQVQDVMSDGKVNVSYFNPGEIHVAESRFSPQEGRVKLFVKLQDVGYPGCTYTLFYFPEDDALAGVYYQAAVDRTYEVIFVRKKSREEYRIITGPVWQWTQTLYNDDRKVVPPDPENYTVEILEDGTISVKAGCNQKGGTISIPRGEMSISIEITESTMAFCPEGSLEDEFVKGLSAAAIYYIRNGDLYIDLKYDSGTMQFLKQKND